MRTSSLKLTVLAAALLCTLSAQAQFGGIGKKEEPKPAPAPAVAVAPAAPVVAKPAPAPAAAAAVVVTKPKPQPVKAAAPAAATAAAVAKPTPAPPLAKLSQEDMYAEKLSKAMAASAKHISTDTKDAELRLTIADLSFIDALASVSKAPGIDYASDMYTNASTQDRNFGKEYALAKHIDIKVTQNISPKRKKQLVQDFLSYAGSRAQLTKSNTLIKIINSPSSNRLSDAEAAEMKKMLSEVFNAPFEIILESGTESSISVVNDTLATTQTPLFGVVKSSVTVELDKTNPIATGIGQLFSLIDKKGQVANMVKQTEKVWLLDIKLDNGDTISVKQTVEDDNTFADKARVGILSFGDKQKAFALVK